MSRKRKPKEPERIVTIVGQEQPKKAQTKPSTLKLLPSFEVWWALMRSRKQLPEHLKAVIKKHFEVKGYLDSKRFDEGLVDFGIKT